MKKTLLLLMLLLTAIGATAQTAAVKWRTSVRLTSATEGIVTVRAIIPEGWHLYGLTMPEGGPRATSLDFSGSRGVKFAGDIKAESAYTTARDEAFGMDLQWWTGRVAFTQRFRLTGDAADARINIKINYMMCNGANCMPPRTENISAPIPPLKK